MIDKNWHVSCVDQRYDDEGFELGRSTLGANGKWYYEIYGEVFATRKEAENVADFLNKEMEYDQASQAS